MYKYFWNIKKQADKARRDGNLDLAKELYGLLEIAAKGKYADLNDGDILDLAEYCITEEVGKVIPKDPPAKKKKTAKKTVKKDKK